MTYIEHINCLLRAHTSLHANLVIFGQNVAAGSHISGMTKNLAVGDGGMIINTTNSENALTNVGFGMMLGGVSSIFFMKQQDFLLLGIDPLVNTYNFVRRTNTGASFTIFFIVVDSGYQGLQSSLNNFGDLCSIARISGYTIQTKSDADAIIASHLVSPGFRIIGISQRLFQQEIIDCPATYTNGDASLFQYSSGIDATIVCFNFSLPYGFELLNQFQSKKMGASLFSVNSVTPIPWHEIMRDVQRTKNLIVIDDSKSTNLSCDNLVSCVLKECTLQSSKVIKRQFDTNWLAPQKDDLAIDYKSIIAGIGRSGRAS